MARPRVYRHDVRCPECGSGWMPKDGASKGRQVYHCGDCGRRTIHDAAYQRPGAADKERALVMYTGGQFLERHCLDFRGQRLGGEPVGQKGARCTVPDAPPGRKTHCRRGRQPAGGRMLWVWTVVVREADGSRWADFELGDRSAETFLRLYERPPEVELYCTDGYASGSL